MLQARGVVRRSPETVNPKMPTGEVEVQVEELKVISTSTPLPFQLDDENVDEALRMKYRWLDLRREHMQRNIRTRAQLVRIIREEMEREGFVDIETPILWKPTPEGARDFLVPGRGCSRASSTRCRSRRRSRSSCSSSPASSATTRSHAVSGTRIRAPIACRS